MTGSSRSLGTRKPKLPGYLLHAASGQARTIIGGRTYYLGEYGSEESRRRYGELIAEHAAGTRVDPFAKSASVVDASTGNSVHSGMYVEFVISEPQSTELGCLNAELDSLGPEPLGEFLDDIHTSIEGDISSPALSVKVQYAVMAGLQDAQLELQNIHRARGKPPRMHLTVASQRL